MAVERIFSDEREGDDLAGEYQIESTVFPRGIPIFARITKRNVFIRESQGIIKKEFTKKRKKFFRV